MRILFLAAVLAVIAFPALAQPASDQPDSDHDGLSDAFEQQLLIRFQPHFRTDAADCSSRPALFTADLKAPTVASEDGTIYGQAFKTHDHRIELHYYHLWRADCGAAGHPLDTEHVATLLTGQGTNADDWRALYWYAAAHEETLCDASQVTRARTLRAEDHGAEVWISSGKHASFLNEELCHHGCGADTCGSASPLTVTSLINLGEQHAPMNGATWIASPQWPGSLTLKMSRSDFQPAMLARLEKLPDTNIAWAVPALRPAQMTIAAGGTAATATGGALALGGSKTDTAVVVAGNHTSNALGTGYHATTDALGKTKDALGKSTKSVGRFLGLKNNAPSDKQSDKQSGQPSDEQK